MASSALQLPALAVFILRYNFCHHREGDCCKNGNLETCSAAVILSAAKNPLCNQGDPSVAALPQDDTYTTVSDFYITLEGGDPLYV